jgi:outer membrane protein TolC
MNCRKHIIACIVMLAGLPPAASLGQTFTLPQAEERAREHYPLLKQKGLIQKASDLTQQNLDKYFLPQVTVGGQATYQSDVTMIEIPNAPFKVEPLSKDQYRVNVDVNQMVYDGGTVRTQREMTKLQSRLDDSRLEVEMYRLRERVDQLYFNILYMDAMIGQINAVGSDIDNGIKKVSAQVDGGVALRSSLDVLKAERIRTDQRKLELEASRSALMQSLGILTDTLLDGDSRLAIPADASVRTLDISRPEQEVYRTQIALSEKQQDMVSSRLQPRASVFVQGGYGRPGLNMLKNEFALYGLGGVRLNWSLGNMYTSKNEKELARLNASMARSQEETFLRNTEVQVKQQTVEIEKLKKLILSDREIITLRESVKKAALAQLEAGVINSSDYLREVNAEDQSRQALKAHEIQLAQASAGLQWLLGSK